MKTKVKLHSFPNLGYLTSDVPEDLLNQLKEIIQGKQLFSANDGLAGNIKKEFYIPTAIPIFEKYIIDLSIMYEEYFDYLKDMHICTNPVPLILERMWVNFQTKYEFNPLHDHNGLYSFVIWVKIPYSQKQEEDNSPGKSSNHNVPGCFEFAYTNALGNIKGAIIPAYDDMEGKICLFPAKMKHVVYPFYTSDDFRISVSGNLCLKT